MAREAMTDRGRAALGRFGHNGPSPRYANAALSVWLFISAFLWQHFQPLRANTWVVAVLMFITSFISAATPSFRYVNTVLAVWLFITTLSMRHMEGTVVNNLIVAILVFAISLIPSGSARGRPASV